MWAMAARALAGNAARKTAKSAVKKAATDVTATSTSEVAAAAKKIAKPKKTASTKTKSGNVSALNPLNWMKEKTQQVKNAGFNEEALDILSSIDETLKRMLYLQQRAISGAKEEDAKTSSKQNLIDKAKDVFKGFGFGPIDGLAVAAMNIKPIFNALGSAVQGAIDALKKFGDWLFHPEKWFGGDSSKEKSTVENVVDNAIKMPIAGAVQGPSTPALNAVKKIMTSSTQPTSNSRIAVSPSGIKGSLNEKQLTTIKQTILKGESINGSYGSYRAQGKGGTDEKLLKMTLDQVLKAQKNKKYSMVGGFQYSKGTLEDIVNRMKRDKIVSGNELFDMKLQNKIVDYSLQNDSKFKDLRSFALGDASKKNAAQTAIAREWRGIADITGKTYADKDSKYNKAVVTDPEVKKMLDTVINQRTQPTVQQVSNDRAPVIINNNSTPAKEKPMSRMVTPADSPVGLNKMFTQFGINF